MSEATQTEQAVDPVKFTRERLAEIGNVWVGFAKAKLGPYLEKPQKWLEQQRKAKPAGDDAATAPTN